MTKVDTVFSGSIPALYDKHLGPLLFEPYAEDLARRLSDLTAGTVLEVAAGTGIVTRALIRALPNDVRVVATDLNQPMLDHAAAQERSGRVTWQQADAQALPSVDASFEAVVSQFGVMFFPDKGQAFREARRVLKPRGRYVFNVWDRLADNEFADIITSVAAELFPDDPPLFLARTPHGYNDKELIVAELKKAGFVEVACETVAKRSRAPSSREPAIGFVQGSPLRNEIEARRGHSLAEVTDAAAARIASRFGPGPVDGKIQALVFTAR
jgi:ubiquinone/menaquinone biosynthesis C-methylase UbiE